MPRRRYGKPLDVMQLRAVLSQSIRDTKALTDAPDASPALVLKVAHALAQLAGPYTRLLEGDMEQRMLAVEARLEAHGKT